MYFFGKLSDMLPPSLLSKHFETMLGSTGMVLAILGKEIFAPKPPLVQRPKVSNSSCLFVRHPGVFVIFTKRICAGFTPFSRSCHFNLDFQESREITKKLANHISENTAAGPRFGTFFVIFSEKVPFFPARPGEGPAPSAQPCPAGQSS